MITEVAILHIISDKEEEFERDFSVASKYISMSEGYIRHSLSKCIEHNNKYLLLVEWQSLENHTIGFRNSDNYILWKNLLHKYYDPFPVVEHYINIYG